MEGNGLIYLTKQILEEIKKGKKTTPDLGLTKRTIEKKEIEGLPEGKIREKFVYVWNGKELYELALFEDGFYKLRLMKHGPILEINGLRMHLRDFKDVRDYSKLIVKKLKIGNRDTVLDICTGLGYTAIEASKKAKRVITIEKSSAVIKLAEWNPWSTELKNKNIEIIHGDALQEIEKLRGIDIIIHDPPRISTAGELYSKEFYEKLYKISKPNAMMFHYAGSLKKGRYSEGIKKRLEKAGWKILSFHQMLQGFFCRKS